jgi:hypothetical protein
VIVSAKRSPINKVEAERDAKIRRNIDRFLAIEAGLMPPPARHKGSRGQDLIKQIAGEIWPGGYKHVEPKDIIKGVGDELKRRRLSVPKRDVFLRALGRRKG